MAVYTTIDDPSAYFKVSLHTGNNTNDHAITFDDTDTTMQPDLVWIKSRYNTEEHMITDSVRPINNYLASNNTDAEDVDSDNMQSLDSNGFTMGVRGTHNANTIKYVAWCWKMGTTSGISGTGNLTVNGYSFNSTAKQSVIVYTGNGGSSGTYTHGLGSAPGFIFGKNRDEAGDGWFAYHHKNTSAPETDYLVPNTTAVTADSDGYWNDVAPTSTLVTVGSAGEVNRAEQQVAYCFAEVQGYSKIGTYTGNGNADGTFVYTGFRPAFTIIKDSGNSADWVMHSKGMNDSNPMLQSLEANGTASQYTTAGKNIDYLSNGFKCRGTDTAVNGSGRNFVYIAFAEAPFVNSNGVPSTAR